MKFVCESNGFLKSINIVEKAIPQKSALPITENILLEVRNSELILQGNNLEIGIKYIMPIENADYDGKVLIKAKTLNSIISKLLNQKLDVEINENNKVNIKVGKVGFDILGMSSEEYPHFPEIESGVKLELSVQDIKDLIKYTLFAVSQDETKPFLNGVLVKKEQDNLLFISTDGFRLAIKKHNIGAIESDFSVIIPYKTLNELNKILGQIDNNSKIQMIISNNQVSFEMPNFVMISRVIQGQFPDYNQVMPKSSVNQFSISRRAFIDSVERAGIIAGESNNVIRVNVDLNTISIKAVAPKMGEFKEEIDLVRHIGDEEVKIAFNYKLILDALKNMDADDIKIEVNDGLAPCIIKADTCDDFIYIIMPIRTSDYHDVDSNEV